MPPSPPPLLFFSLLLLLLLLLTSTSASTHTQPSRRLLQSTLPPPPPPPPPHHHHHTPRSPPPPQPLPPPPQPTPAQPTPTPSNPPPASAPPPTPTPTPTPTPIPIPPPPPPPPRFTSTSATPTPTPDDGYPFANYPFFPSASPPPPPPSSADQTFPANISTLVAPNNDGSSGSAQRRFPVLQAVLLAFLSLCLLLLSALLSIHLFRRLSRHSAHHAAGAGTHSHSASSSARRGEDEDEEEEDGDEEGRSLKPPPMPTSSTNPSTEFLYLGTLASSTTAAAPPPPGTTSHPRPGSPELRPLPPLPRVGPPSGEFFAAAAAMANPASLSSSSLSPSSPSASSPTLGSSPVRVRAVRPPSIPLPRGRALDPNPSPPKRRPPPPPPPHAWNPFVPAPPQQASPSDGDDGGESYTTEMRKSRPLHSDKLKPVSLHMKDEMIQMYLNNSAMASAREVCLLGSARCHGIGMVLGALGVSEEQVRDALLEGNAHGLGVEALRMLNQLVLTNEEDLKLRYFKDDPPAKLCTVDAFLKTILDVPFAFKRVDAMLYVSNFYLEVNQLRMSYATLEAACQELRSSRLFHKVLGAVLNFGNLMSINTGSPNSHALEPNTLLKIVDVKGADGKAALLQFVVQEIVKPEGNNNLNPMHSGSVACKTNASTNTLQYDIDCRKHGLQVISRLAAELTSTKKAASIDITSLSRAVSGLGIGLGKIHDVLRLNSMSAPAESARRFHDAMGTFLRQAEEEVLGLQGQESVCLSSVREMAEYFHGSESASGDEARLFRVFTGVREFMAMLDRVCREAGEINGERVGPTTVNWRAAVPAPMGMMTP